MPADVSRRHAPGTTIGLCCERGRGMQGVTRVCLTVQHQQGAVRVECYSFLTRRHHDGDC